MRLEKIIGKYKTEIPSLSMKKHTFTSTSFLRYNSGLAGWQSGYAAACKAVYAGSIPASASIM